MKQLLTHSRIHSFKTCRKRHWWEYEIGLRKDIDAKALRMGSAGHDGLDALKQGKDIEEAVAAVHGHYATIPDGMDEYDWEIEWQTIETLVWGYEWRWGSSQLKVIATEQGFQIPLTNPTTRARSQLWDLAGKIDGIVRLEDSRLAVLEHKFLGEPIAQDSDYWKRLQLDPQITIYVHAARKLGFDVATVLYDVIRKPTIKPEAVPILDESKLKIVLDTSGERVLTKQGNPRQTGNTAEGYVLQTRPMTGPEWSHKLLEDIGNRPEFYYARQEIARLDLDVDECLEALWDVQKVIRDAQLRNRWYRTVGRDSCPWCPWFGLCTSRYNPADDARIPEGFVKLDCVHPELEEVL